MYGDHWKLKDQSFSAWKQICSTYVDYISSLIPVLLCGVPGLEARVVSKPQQEWPTLGRGMAWNKAYPAATGMTGSSVIALLVQITIIKLLVITSFAHAEGNTRFSLPFFSGKSVISECITEMWLLFIVVNFLYHRIWNFLTFCFCFTGGQGSHKVLF